MQRAAATNLSIRRIEGELERAGAGTTYARRLEALLAVARGAGVPQAARDVDVSARSLRRWLRVARRRGPAALTSKRSDGRPTRLPPSMFERLRVELQRPEAFGHDSWTGALLSTHLRRRYRVMLGARQCRRLLRTLGLASPPRRAVAKAVPPPARAFEPRERRSPPLTDHERKRRALRRIQRLAIAGLPLRPFVETLIDLVHDAIPYDEANPGLWAERMAAEMEAGSRWVARDHSDFVRWAPALEEMVIKAPPEVSGLRPLYTLRRAGGTVYRSEQLALPHFTLGAAYNDFFLPLAMHHGLLVFLRDGGEVQGHYPIFRSASMKPFTRDDEQFIAVAAPYIAHALRAADLLDSHAAAPADFAPSVDGQCGVIIAGLDGRILGLDRRARALFDELRLLERADGNDGPTRVSAGLDYIARVLRNAMGKPDDAFACDAPALTVWCHRSGVALRLRGLLTEAGGDAALITVLVEHGELREHRWARLALRHGLSPREVEVLRGLAAGATARDLAAQTGLAPATLKGYLSTLRDKLGLGNNADLRRFALEQGPARLPLEAATHDGSGNRSNIRS